MGGINETDISLAAASNAIVIGFNVRADAAAKKQAQQEGIELNYFSIIYDVINPVYHIFQVFMGVLFGTMSVGNAGPAMEAIANEVERLMGMSPEQAAPPVLFWALRRSATLILILPAS